MTEPTSVIGPEAEPENQSMPVSVAPISNREKWQQKSDCLVRKETLTKRENENEANEAGLSQK